MANRIKYSISIGQQFTHLKVISPYVDTVGKYKSTDRRFNCTCVCGENVVATVTDLYKGKTTSCGCKRIPHNVDDYVFERGHTVGKLTVERLYTGPKVYAGTNKRYLCKCKCGDEVIVLAHKLGKKQVKACNKCKNKTHSMSNTAEYKAWTAMKQRCYNSKNPNYEHYGARGITVCDRWLGEKGFENFLSDMGTRPSNNHSLDRKEVNGDYCPTNCRWTTGDIQNVNKRKVPRSKVSKTSSKFIGVTKPDRKSSPKYTSSYSGKHLGTFDTEIDAAHARDEYVKSLFGDEVVSTNKSLGLY